MINREDSVVPSHRLTGPFSLQRAKKYVDQARDALEQSQTAVPNKLESRLLATASGELQCACETLSQLDSRESHRALAMLLPLLKELSTKAVFAQNGDRGKQGVCEAVYAILVDGKKDTPAFWRPLLAKVDQLLSSLDRISATLPS